jgi:preprotein translocase subunit SecG
MSNVRTSPSQFEIGLDSEEHINMLANESNFKKRSEKLNWQKISVIVAVILFVLGLVVNYLIQQPTTNYAPQTAEVQSGNVIQVQGNGNTIVPTLNHEPITQYKILSTSEKRDGNLLHTKLEVLVSFDKQGGLQISPKIYCEEYKDRERRVFQFEGGAYSGLVFNLDCKSSEPMQEESGEYFKYINNG